MSIVQVPQDLLTTFDTHIPVWGFLLNLVLSGALTFLLGVAYVRFGKSLSNRPALARTFTMIGLTTMLIITIVKSSLALSLGLVGALSIIRFRTAIKEPEELAFLFLTIAIGLGLGADQRLITLTGFAVIMAIIIIRGTFTPRVEHSNLLLTVKSRGENKLSLREITETVRGYCTALDLKRFDDGDGVLEASYLVSFDDYGRLEDAKKELESRADGVTTSFVDNSGLG